MHSVFSISSGYSAATAPEYRWTLAGSRSGYPHDAAAAGVYSPAAADAGRSDAASTKCAGGSGRRSVAGCSCAHGLNSSRQSTYSQLDANTSVRSLVLDYMI